MERHLLHKGFMAAQDLQALFSAVRANDLIWSSVVNHYLLDREAPPSDILYWFADGAHIPRAFLLEWARDVLRDNKLAKGGLVLDGVKIDLGAVKTPLLAISLKDDHVSAWQATYDSARLLGGEVAFLLGGSGHNAGVINPPSANKHGYWVNAAMPETAEAWLEGAERREGSWWPHWQSRLSEDGKAAKVQGAGARQRQDRRRWSRRRAPTSGTGAERKDLPRGFLGEEGRGRRARQAAARPLGVPLGAKPAHDALQMLKSRAARRRRALQAGSDEHAPLRTRRCWQAAPARSLRPPIALSRSWSDPPLPTVMVNGKGKERG